MSETPRWRMKTLYDGMLAGYYHPYQNVSLYDVRSTGLWEVWVDYRMEVRTPHKDVAVRYIVDNGWGLDEK